jgi:hypothetical protein
LIEQALEFDGSDGEESDVEDGGEIISHGDVNQIQK